MLVTTNYYPLAAHRLLMFKFNLLVTALQHSSQLWISLFHSADGKSSFSFTLLFC